MTLDQYCAYLERRALGWLDWSEERVLYADLNAIEVGIAGKIEMFEFLGLIKPKQPEAPAGPPLDARGNPIVLTPSNFDQMFPDKEPGTWQIRHKPVVAR